MRPECRLCLNCGVGSEALPWCLLGVPGVDAWSCFLVAPCGSRQAGILCPATSGESSTWGSISTGLCYVLSGATHTEEMGAGRAQLRS